MGLTHLSIEIANPARPSRRARRKMLVDSGAMYSIVDGQLLRRLGIRPTGTRTFVLADGTQITRETGVITLEEFGLVLDPVRGELRPIPMPLMLFA